MTDEFFDCFTENFKDESMFLEFLYERENDVSWESVSHRDIKFIGLEYGDAETESIEDFLELDFEEGVFEDTMKNTSLVAEFHGRFFAIRDTAIKTLLERAGIYGQALKRVPKKVLGEILNHCIETSKGKSLILRNYDKISAFHSGDNSYSVLEMYELFSLTSDYLSTKYPGSNFIEATYDHSLTTGLWEIKNSDLTDAYVDFLNRNDLNKWDEIRPTIRVTTSDVGISSVTITPMLFVDDTFKITLGSPLKLAHRNKADISDFEKNLDLIFPQFDAALGKLMKLALIEVRYPRYCMGSVMKKIGIHKSLGLEVLENFMFGMGSKPITAHEIYCSINEVLFIMTCNKESQTKIAKTEEMIARALNIRWQDYDLSGEFTW